MQRRHNAEHVAHFQRHGWVLIEHLLTANEIDAALPGLFELYPTPQAFHAGDPRSAAYRAEAHAPENAGDEARFRPLQFVGLKEFPFTQQILNRLALHPAIIQVAEDLLATRDVRLYQAETFAQYT